MPTIADVPEIVVDFVDVPDENLPNVGAKGLGEPPIIPTAAAIANAFPHATGRRCRRAADDAGPRPGGARVSEYARPGSLDEALELLDGDGAAPLAGGTDLAGQIDRGITLADLLVDLQDAGLGAIEERDGGLRIGATVTLADARGARRCRGVRGGRARRRRSQPRRSCETSAPSAATSASTRGAGTTAGSSGTAGSAAATRAYAQIGDHRKHGLEPGDCISAHPSDLAPALAACGATVVVAGRGRGSGELPLLELYRRPTGRQPLAAHARAGRARGRGAAARRRRTRPPTSELGERQAFSFPLVSVAAARRGEEVRLVAAGVANIPRELDPADPLAGLPGNPQSAWKRTCSRRSSSGRVAGVQPDRTLREERLA